MKAVQIEKFGTPEVLHIASVDTPKPGLGQVLVKVHAASINPFDIKFSEGIFAPPGVKFPIRLGGDFAGVIAEIGQGVEDFKVGNHVYGSANILSGGSGSFAEYAVVPTKNMALLPMKADFTEAAAIVLTGVSAVQALIGHVKLQAGQKILIHGGSGGIGTIAIQLAKHVGAKVITTTTGDGLAYVKKLGADQVIDYKTEHFWEMVKDCDAVFDTVGGETFEHSFSVLKKGGILVSMIAKDEHEMGQQHGIEVINQFTKVTREHLDMLSRYMENGAIKPHIDKIFTLDKIKEAFQEQKEGGVLGKIVVEITSK